MASFDVAVETASGVTVTCTIGPSDTIEAVKAKIADKAGTPEDSLSFAGLPLDDAQTVAACGIEAGSVLQHLGAYFAQGEGTLRVPMTLHLRNRERLMAHFDAPDVPPNSFILLQGGEEEALYDTDREKLFRQESYFHWATGVAEPGFYAVLDITNRKTVLFMPRLPPEYAVWMGIIHSPQSFRKKYGVDEVRFVDQLDEFMSKADPAVIYTLKGPNSDSGSVAKPASYGGIAKHRCDDGRLFPLIANLRVIKTPEEIEVMRYVAEASSAAHKRVMSSVRPGMKEYVAEARFKNEVYYNWGCRNMSYTCIAASGGQAATLHYGHAGEPNAKLIEDGDLLLFDMGAEYHCYASDITCSYPANGVFTPEQREVYETCYEAVMAVESAMKPGVNWANMHRLADRTIVAGLLKRGYLHDGTVDEMVAARIGALFMPHGLGHLMGIDTHDVGGYLKGCPERVMEPGLKSLRTARDLEENMVLTVEPGVYFIEHLLQGALANPAQAKFLNMAKIDTMRGKGGVRIEDDVLVTATGIENFTKVPRTVDAIEAFMAEARASEEWAQQGIDGPFIA